MNTTIDILCSAISQSKVVAFWYHGGKRKVEPHMVAHDELDHLALSGWFLSGYSESGSGPGWRTYHINEISELEIIDETFRGPRPGYKPDGGQEFHSVVCAL